VLVKKKNGNEVLTFPARTFRTAPLIQRCAILGAAFDAAWDALQKSGSPLKSDAQAMTTRERLAKRIIEMGQNTRDHQRLVAISAALGAPLLRARGAEGSATRARSSSRRIASG
jgi:hypothetical protein